VLTATSESTPGLWLTEEWPETIRRDFPEITVPEIPPTTDSSFLTELLDTLSPPENDWVSSSLV